LGELCELLCWGTLCWVVGVYACAILIKSFVFCSDRGWLGLKCGW